MDSATPSAVYTLAVSCIVDSYSCTAVLSTEAATAVLLIALRHIDLQLYCFVAISGFADLSLEDMNYSCTRLERILTRCSHVTRQSHLPGPRTRWGGAHAHCCRTQPQLSLGYTEARLLTVTLRTPRDAAARGAECMRHGMRVRPLEARERAGVVGSVVAARWWPAHPICSLVATLALELSLVGLDELLLLIARH